MSTHDYEWQAEQYRLGRCAECKQREEVERQRDEARAQIRSSQNEASTCRRKYMHYKAVAKLAQEQLTAAQARIAELELRLSYPLIEKAIEKESI